MSREQLSEEIHQRLGYRRLSRAWAKLEILLGLTAVGVGVLLGQQASVLPGFGWEFLSGALALFVLGGYLTLAGHRSHLYRAENDRLILLVEEFRQQQGKGPHS